MGILDATAAFMRRYPPLASLAMDLQKISVHVEFITAVTRRAVWDVGADSM